MKRGVKRIRPTSSLHGRGKNQPMGSIRLISGQWKGRKLPVLDAEGLRPTTDRTKETLFNWLMHDIQNAKCLDVFAGTGSLGLECLSRYADSCTFIELNGSAVKQLQQNVQSLNASPEQFTIYQGNSLDTLKQVNQGFDVVFLDPPFHKDLLQPAIDALCNHNLLTPDALVYVECSLDEANYDIPNNWQLTKQKQTKQVSACLYQLENNNE